MGENHLKMLSREMIMPKAYEIQMWSEGWCLEHSMCSINVSCFTITVNDGRCHRGVMKSLGLRVILLGLNPGSATSQLCDLGQVA